MSTPVLILLFVAALAVLTAAVYVCLTAPVHRRAQMKPFTEVHYAHRGLHGEGVAENSMTAFRLAVEGGYGIELDVRLSADDEVVIMHDPTLKRVAGDERAVRQVTAQELDHMSLGGTCDGIPRLRDVLAMVDGRVPLLIEIKEEREETGEVVARLLPLLADYRGPFLIESFNPLTLGCVRRRAPQYLRGLLCDRYREKGLRYRLMERFLLNHVARPSFIAYQHAAVAFGPFRRFCRLYRPTLLAWTTRTQAEEDAAYRAGFEAVVFEHYIPMEKETHI